MIEKRFRKGDNLSCVDIGTGKSYYYPCNLVGLLNEQQSIIEYLTIEKHQADKRFQTIIAELKKDNEQLKRKLQSVTMLKDDYEELIESFEKKYGKNIEDVVDDE